MVIVTAVKCVKQHYSPTERILTMMETFRRMVNDCLRIGLKNDVSSLKSLSKLCYPVLATYDITSYYKLHAISKAAGILSNRKQSIKRGYPTRTPYMKRVSLISSYGFKVENSVLKVPLGDAQYFIIPLNAYVKGILSDPTLRVRSFTLTASNTMSICYSREITELEPMKTKGVDRNLRNLTVGDNSNIVQYDLTKAVNVSENTRSIIKALKRNDVRIRKRIASKYGRRRADRIRQLLHHVSKAVVKKAEQDNAAIVFEDITRIRKLYQRGNGQGSNYRSKLNGWSFAEIKRQIEYKAAWEGVPVIKLSSSKTRGTSQLCPRCGKRVQGDGRNDPFHKRELWCSECKVWMDRDVVAAMNIARKGGEVFHHSKGLADEAMRGNPMKAPVILRVDAGELT